jgi:pimeloyl-ACP methyl ester carboxylesterase
MSLSDGTRCGEAAVNGTRLYYEIAGTGSPLVLVSGGGTLDAGHMVNMDPPAEFNQAVLSFLTCDEFS